MSGVDLCDNCLISNREIIRPYKILEGLEIVVKALQYDQADMNLILIWEHLLS